MRWLSARSLGLMVRRVLVLLVSLAIVLLAAAPLAIPGYGQIAINAGLICVFHWAVFRPDVFPAASAFLLGTCHDAIVGAPLGLNAMILLVAYGLAESQEAFLRARTYIGQWLCFAVVAAIAVLIMWAAMMVIRWTLIDPLPAVFHLIVTVGAYPPISWLLSQLQARLLLSHA